MGVIITVIVLALAGIGIGIYALIRTINKTHEKIELIEESFEPDFDEISVSAQPVPTEETAIAEETITETYANTYPDYHFGSEWESKKQSVATCRERAPSAPRVT